MPEALAERQADGRRRDDPLTMASPSFTSDRFNAIADRLTRALGSMQALVGSVVLVVVWALTGPIFKFSDTWQLFINTSTTVITFWMVFVIQNSANREAKATQLKLDELIRALADARNDFIALDRAPEKVLVEREQEFEQMANSGGDASTPAAPATDGNNVPPPPAAQLRGPEDNAS
jgi:low affinity Fe/Cu permease